jgi:dTDP-6-deoxy-L-talose 4-dehydrogenase (NAD+)
MKILVTGACGYIGKHVVKTLLDNGHSVIALEKNISTVDPRAQSISIDIFKLASSENMDDLRILSKCDVCLHLAWQDGFLHNSYSHIENISNHFMFIKKMVETGIEHIAVMGSMHEIGYHIGSIDENTPCNPISMYGIAKDALRRSLLLLTSSSKTSFQWIRGFYIFGDDKYNNSIFSKLLNAAEKGEKRFPFTTGKNKYDFLEVSELASQITACITQNKITGIINCCSGYSVSLADKVEQFIKDNKLDIQLEYGVFPDRPYDSPEIYGDSKKIRMIMGWRNDINRE